MKRGMNLNKAGVSLIFFLLVLGSAVFGQGNRRLKFSINEAWSFYKGDKQGAEQLQFSDSSWKKVNLPHTWNAEDCFDNEPGYYRGVGWYRKKMFISDSMKNKRLFIYFEAANQVADVYINGQPAGDHKGGYAAFCFDITPFVRYGADNQLAIKVNNTHDENIPPLSGDWNFYGGVYRDVFLIATSNIHFDMLDLASPGVYIETPQVSEKTANIKIRGTIVNQTPENKTFDIVTKVLDAGGNVIAEKKTSTFLKANNKGVFGQLTDPIAEPHLWSPDHPYLYSVVCTIYQNGIPVDEIIQHAGFRWFSCDVHTGFQLNGKPLKLKGACRTQDYPGLGFAIPDELNRYDAQLLKEMGINFVRAGHYIMGPAFLDEMDRLGILVWEEISISDIVCETEGFYETSSMMVKEMLRQHYNHPSIIMWGNMNEVFLLPSRALPEEQRPAIEKKTLEIANKLEVLMRNEDPVRLTGTAFHENESYVRVGLHKITRIIGWNIYSGWYSGEFEDFSKLIDEEHARYPDVPLIVSEYGAGSDKRINSLNPETFDFSNQYAQLYHEYYYPEIAKRPFIIGSNIWNFMDFGVELRGESMPHVNNKGMVNFNREKKDIFYYYQSAFSDKRVLHIASRDWEFRKGAPANETDNFITQPVKVYSNLQEVELFVNERSTGKKSINNYNAIWNVNLVNGKNRIEVIGYDNGKKLSDVFYVDAAIQPHTLSSPLFNEIAVNTGATYQFCNPVTHFVWEADQAYKPGSWGYVGGDIYRLKQGRIGNVSDIKNTDEDPIFQTSREGVQAYLFDVADGEYEVELRFNEPNTKPDQIFYDVSQEIVNAEMLQKRVFDVYLNNQLALADLNIAKQYGVNTAVYFKYDVVAGKNGGIAIRFVPKKGKTIISGIRIIKK